MALDPNELWFAGGGGVVAVFLTKLSEVVLARWLHKTSDAVESVPALDASVKALQKTVVDLQGLVAKVNGHDFALSQLREDVRRIERAQDSQKDSLQKLDTALEVMAEKASHTESRADELKQDVRQLGVKLDAFADRVQSLVLNGAKQPPP